MLFGLVATLVTAGCAGDEPESETATNPETGASGGEPEPLSEDQSQISLGSATSEIVMTEDVDNQLAALSLGTPAEPEETTPAPQATSTRDPGLGQSGGRTLSASQIQTSIRTNQGSVRACYERELKSAPALRGKVVMAFTIGADGRVRSPRSVRNTTGSRELIPCMKKAIKGWRFAKAESPSDIEYPFVFKPKDY